MKSSTVLCVIRCRKDALLMDEADSVQHPRPAKPIFSVSAIPMFALMKAPEAMERNDGDGRAEYNMVRAHAGLPARKSSLANILEDRQVMLAGETCHRQGPAHPFRQVPQVLASSPFCSVRSLVLFHRLPDTSAKPCLQWQVGSEQRI